jgi:hypothetical protein
MNTNDDPTFDCAVDYDVDTPCVTMVFRGYATSAQFREANERVLLAVTERRASKLLGDARDFVLIASSDQNWLASNWIPRVLAAGVRRFALVMPRFYFNRVAVDTVSQRMAPEFAKNLVQIEYFETREAARKWLAVL